MDEIVKSEFFNNELGFKVRTISNGDGSISINAEDAAIGYGWTQTKNEKEYVRWETLNGYCNDLGFSQQVGKEDYIPEGLFYLLGMKANNETALKYQRWLAFEVLPTIRKHGIYITDEAYQEYLHDKPQFELRLKEAHEEIQTLRLENKDLEEANELLTNNYNDIRLMRMNTTNEVAEYVEEQLVYSEKGKVMCAKLYSNYQTWCSKQHHYTPYSVKQFEELVYYCLVQGHPIVKQGNYYIGIEVRK